jgi:hypothetical protein
VINSTTPAWIDAAKYTLTERGDKATGWGVAHRLNLWARVQDGERAHDLLEQLLKVNTATNLWDLHPPFQIDGNLGGTSGIAEMLLQSHATYLEPLAAIPSVWANGSYTGLVARGNFEVSAAWADGLATSFNIISKSGGDLSVKYSGIENATVTDSKGRSVSYDVIGSDVISFETNAGETYYIWGFTAKNAPRAVCGVNVKSEPLGSSEISWNASRDAVAYKVYVAKDDAPEYTLLKVTNDTSYTYERPLNDNARLTFAVTAVGADGSESARALAYRNPDDISSPVLDVSANVVNGELQVAIKSTEYSEKFRLYTKKGAADEWKLVSESKYPVIIDGTYVKTNVYGVSAINRFGEESEIVKIGVYNVSTGTVDYNSANIFDGAVFTPTDAAKPYQHSNPTYGDYGKLTDGSLDTGTGRFSTKATSADILEGTLLLPAAFLLGELKIYDFNGWSTTAQHAGEHLKVEVYYNGEWTTVKECFSNAEIVKLRKSDAKGNYLSVDLSTYKAQLIRLRIDTPASGGSISINEIMCTGVAIGDGLIYSSNVFTGYVFTATDPTAGSAWKPYEYITDGLGGWSDPGRFATNSGKPADGTLSFGGKVFALSELKIEYTAPNLCGLDIAIYVYRNGQWTKVVDKAYSEQTSGITFDLKGVLAEAVRFTSSGNFPGGNYIGISEMTCTGYDLPYAKAATENILLGTTKDQLTLIGANPHPSVPNIDYAFDGNKTTRYAVNDVYPYSYSLEIELTGTYELYNMSFYPFYNGGEKSRSDDTKIEVFNNGVWTTVVTGFTIEPAYVSEVSLGGAVGSRIRITFKNTQATQNATLYEIECTGVQTVETANKEDTSSNVLANRNEDQVVLGNASVHVGAGPLTDAFDGNKSTRFALAGAPAYATLEITLDNAVPLYTMEIYPFYNGDTVSRSNDTKFEVYIDGVWITVATGVEIAPTAAPTVVSFDGITAEKIRITFKNKTGSTNASIFEITCTTGVVDAVDRKALLEAYVAMDNIAFEGLGALEIKQSKMYAMRELLMDTKADKSTIESYTAAVNSCAEELRKVSLTDKYGDFTSYNLELSDRVGINLYGKLENLPENSYAVIRMSDGATVKAPLTDLSVDDLGRSILCISVPSYATLDDITVALIFNDASYTEQMVISVKGYADTVLSSSYEAYYHGINELARALLESEYDESKHAMATPELLIRVASHECTGGTSTCTEYAVCTVCGMPYGDLNSNAHVWGNGSVTLAPTCDEKGIKTYICQNSDSHTYTEQIPATGHSYDKTVIAPDCTNTGYTKYMCSVCNHSYVGDEIGALGHTDENNDYICDVCEEDLCTEHNEQTIPGKDPTCTESGLTEGKKCSVCGEILHAQEQIPAAGHSYKSIVTAPDCENAGYTTHTCSDCGDSYVTDRTDALGHTEQVLLGKAPTCTDSGLTEGKKCSVCDKVLVEQEEILADGHTYEQEVIEPTCTDKGYTTFTCHCGDTYTDFVTEASGHDWAEATTEAPKTCKSCGVTEGDKLPEDVTTPDEDQDKDSADSEDHSECEPANAIERIINLIINFFRKLVGLPEKCYCGKEI